MVAKLIHNGQWIRLPLAAGPQGPNGLREHTKTPSLRLASLALPTHRTATLQAGPILGERWRGRKSQPLP